MDILAARKKAAERAQTPQPTETKPSPETPPVPPDTLPDAPAELRAAAAAPTSTSAPDVAGPITTAPAEAAPGGSDPNKAPSREVEMLSFNLSNEAYAVFVDDVREVLKVRELTRVPNAAGYILGVTSLRGTMLPVMDLCTRLGLAPVERDDKARIIVVSPDEEDVGLLVDRVTGVIRVLPEAIKPAPDNVEQGAEFLRGIVRHSDKLYIVLDLQKAAG